MKKYVFIISALFIFPIIALSQSLSDSIDVVHYEIHINNIDFDDKTIDAHTILTVKPINQSISGIALELIDLTVTDVQINEESTAYTHELGIIKIPLINPLEVDDSIIIRVNYNGHPFSENWGGFHFSGNYAFNLGVGFQSIPHNLGKSWFPCIDDFHDKATYEFFIHAPNDFKAICSGIEVNDVYIKNKVYGHWIMNQEIPTYLASVAIGDYVKYEDTYNGIENNVPIELWVRPNELEKVSGSFINLKEILHHYESHWGAYPFERVGYVSTAIGAMEHPCNIAYPYGMINGNTTYESLYAHELSHMWFGDLVTCAAATEMWLNEGWAVFNELFFREGLYPEEVWKQEYRNLHAKTLKELHTTLGDGDYYALNNVPLEITYGKTSYDKGGLIVHTLRNYLGDDLFFPAMKNFLNDFAYQSASSYDLMNFLSEQTGVNMQPFFENWIFTPGFPHYEIDSLKHIDNNIFQVFVSQQGKGRTAISDGNITEITFMNNNWEQYSDTMIFNGVTGSKIFSLPFDPVIAMMDFNDKMADATTDEAFIIKETGVINTNTFLTLDVEQIIDSAFIRITHHWVAPDSNALDMEDVTLSDYRFWKVDGLNKDKFTASCKFFFSTQSNLDNTIVVNDNYDVGLFYREDKSKNWRKIPYTLIGPGQIGYLEIGNLKFGEYALGSKKKGIDTQDIKGEVPSLNIYPNPSNNVLNINILNSNIDKLQIINELGAIVSEIQIEKDKTDYQLNISNFPNQLYLVNGFIGKVNVCSKKIIVKH